METLIPEDKIALSGRQRQLLGTYATHLSIDQAHTACEQAMHQIHAAKEDLNSSSPQITSWANPISRFLLDRRMRKVVSFRDTFSLNLDYLDSSSERQILYEINTDCEG